VKERKGTFLEVKKITKSRKVMGDKVTRALYRALSRKARSLDKHVRQVPVVSTLGGNSSDVSENVSENGSGVLGSKTLWLQDAVLDDYKIKPLDFSLPLSRDMLKNRILYRILPNELYPLVGKVPDRNLTAEDLKSLIRFAFRSSNGFSLDSGFAALRALNEQVRSLLLW
jgi:hypothetical protein